MKTYLITTKLYMKKDLHHLEMYEALSKLVNLSFVKDEGLAERHKAAGFKAYVYSMPFPIPKQTGVYKEGKLFQFILKTTDEDFARKMLVYLPQCESHFMKNIVSTMKIVNDSFVSQIRTLTPAVITINSKSWFKNQPLEDLIMAIHNNAMKKYMQLTGETLDCKCFIQGIQVLTEKPFAIPYKGGKIMGHHLILDIKGDDSSQKLAQIVLGQGLSEKNSLGMGYVVPLKNN